MVIYFTEEDLVSFGEYLLGEDRRKLFESIEDPNGRSVHERLSEVHDSDLANWAYLVSTGKQIRQEMNNPSAIN